MKTYCDNASPWLWIVCTCMGETKVSHFEKCTIELIELPASSLDSLPAANWEKGRDSGNHHSVWECKTFRLRTPHLIRMLNTNENSDVS